jgi:hypothetical protein
MQTNAENTEGTEEPATVKKAINIEEFNKKLNNFIRTFEPTQTDNPLLFSLSKHTINTLPSVIFSGPDVSFRDVYLHYLVYKITGMLSNNEKIEERKINVNRNSVTFNFKRCDNYLEFDLTSLSGNTDKFILSEFLENMIVLPNMRFARHIVILNKIDEMSPTSIMCLRRMIEQYSKTTLFLFTCTYPHTLINAITSRNITLRCPLNTSVYNQIFYGNDNIVEKVFTFPEEHNSTILLEFIYTMKKTKNILTFVENVRTFISKILFIETVPNIIIQHFSMIYFKKTKDKRIFQIAQKNDELLILSCRPEFTLEKFFLDVYNICFFTKTT